MNWLRVYLLHRAKKHNDKVLLDILDKPWDGKIESLPHFRGCQCFRGSHGIGAYECDCGIRSVAAHQRGWFLTLVRCRYRCYAKYLGQCVHPIRLFQSLKDENQLRSYFRELVRQVREGTHLARRLYLVEPPSPNPEPRDVALRRLLTELGIIAVDPEQVRTEKQETEHS